MVTMDEKPNPGVMAAVDSTWDSFYVPQVPVPYRAVTKESQTVSGRGAVGISLTAGPGPIKIDRLPVRVAIVGSRSFQDKARVRELIVGLRELYGIDGVQFVTGDCPTGVDAFVRELLQGRCTVHYANWNLHGESAGPRRNTEVVRDCSELIALVDGRLEESRGTADTVKKARRAGKKVTVWEVE